MSTGLAYCGPTDGRIARNQGGGAWQERGEPADQEADQEARETQGDRPQNTQGTQGVGTPGAEPQHLPGPPTPELEKRLPDMQLFLKSRGDAGAGEQDWAPEVTRWETTGTSTELVSRK